MTERAFEGFAIVEQMGHKTIAGYVRQVELAGVALLRVDVPDGDKPIEEACATQFIHASTLYALTPTAEAIVRKVAARTRVSPAATWGVSALPDARQDKRDQRQQEADDELAAEERPIELVALERDGDPVPLQMAAEASGPDPDDIEF